MASQPIFPAPVTPGVCVRSPAGANDNEAGAEYDTRGMRSSSALPPDAAVLIEPDPLSAHAGRARRGRWIARFKERHGARPDPLMGWTGGGDVLAPLALTFPTREAAEQYCRRLGLSFETRPAPSRRPPQPALQAFEHARSQPALCCWPTGPHARCCGDYPVLKTLNAANRAGAPRASNRATP